MARGPDDATDREAIADGDWLYRRIALNDLRSDGTVNRTAFMRNSTPPRKGKEPDPDVSVDLARLTTPARSLEIAGRPEQGIGRCKPSSHGVWGLRWSTARYHAIALIRRSSATPAIERWRTVNSWLRRCRNTS